MTVKSEVLKNGPVFRQPIFLEVFALCYLQERKLVRLSIRERFRKRLPFSVLDEVVERDLLFSSIRDLQGRRHRR